MQTIIDKPTRVEHDFLGDLEIPSKAYYGIQTYRAFKNFNITGIKIKSEPFFVQALAFVKKAAAMANRDSGVLDPYIAEYIIKAADRLIAGEFHDQFISDFIQGGAGTSCNMNANEVIANVALEMMGYEKGDYQYCHPNNHVNCSQSTNDAYPTAIKIAVYKKLEEYTRSLIDLRDSFDMKSKQFNHVLKMGRTQLQDAVPMSLGSEFHAFSSNIDDEIKLLTSSKRLLTEINMGATAIGTGVNAPEGYADLVTQHLCAITGIELEKAKDLIKATSDTGDYVQLSASLKRTAIKISKICNDLRLLSSGPRAGFNEINLPQMQPGSSIMPGKINPVIPEVVNQTAYYVMGADLTISMAAEAGQLQLNVMEPVISYSLFTSISFMTRAVQTLKRECIDGITANEDHCRQMVMNSVAIVTLISPIIGYEKSSAVSKEALKTGKTVYQIVVKEEKYLTEEKWNEIYSFENLINPKFINS
ncbi:MAG: aspartate ammonia-lyase [Cytophagales bacterium]